MLRYQCHLRPRRKTYGWLPLSRKLDPLKFKGEAAREALIMQAIFYSLNTAVHSATSFEKNNEVPTEVWLGLEGLAYLRRVSLPHYFIPLQVSRSS